jgi:hypothetical protein
LSYSAVLVHYYLSGEFLQYLPKALFDGLYLQTPISSNSYPFISSGEIRAGFAAV